VISTFAGISVIVELLTANGAQRAVNSSSSPSEIAAGKALLKAALILQLFVLALFVGVTGRFHYLCNKTGMLARAGDLRGRILAVLVTLYTSSTLIGTRTIYRTVEYFETAAIQAPQAGEAFDPNSVSPVIRYEWFFYVFEVTLMFSNTMLLNFRHPGKYLPKTITTYLGEDGVEQEGCKFKDPRSIVVQILDPFDIVGLVKGNDKKDRWWEKGNESGRTDVEQERVLQSQTVDAEK
jgi:RTA1 like protein